MIPPATFDAIFFGMMSRIRVASSFVRAVVFIAMCCIAAPASSSDGDDGGSVLDPRLRGVELADIDDDELRAAGLWLRTRGALPLASVLSTGLVARLPGVLVVDAVGRAPRFLDSDTQPAGSGRVGVVRALVASGWGDGMCWLGPPAVVWERSLADLDLHMRVTIGDWTAVVADEAAGFRRVYPLGGGGIDRGVRVPGVLTSMTPTTELGLLEKIYAWRRCSSPWYYRDKPYLPVSVPRISHAPDGAVRLWYYESKVAFHIWQDRGFERGFFSHGCMRMRDEDLAELAAFVFGAPRPIPVVIRIGVAADARHPYPMETTKYWQIKNYGTTTKPRPRVTGILYDMELGTLPLPDPSELKPLDFDDKPIGDADCRL